MTRGVSRRAVVLCSAVGLLSSSSSLLAGSPPPSPPPNEVAYSTNTPDKKVLKLDFATRTSTVVNTDMAQRKRLEGIAVRDDGSALHLLVCDRNANEVLFYQNAQGAGQVITNAIQFPHSVALDQAGNAFVVSATLREVWLLARGGPLPGGYAAPVLIDEVTPSSILKEARIVPFGAGLVQNGDLLVLSRVPAALYRYPKIACLPGGGGCTGFGPRQVLVPPGGFPAGAQPSGFAFAPNQDLLIALVNGKVLRYNANGQRVQPDFITGFGSGFMAIAVGLQDGASRAFVTDQRAGGKIQRLTIKSDGTGQLAGAVSDEISKPWGVSLPQGTPTPVGTDVVVTPSPQSELTFDKVTRPGITTAQILEFEDNRPLLNGGNSFVDQSLKDFFDEDDPLRAQLPDVTIPAHIQAFKKVDPENGTPTFLLEILDSTARFARTVEVHYDEAEQLGYEPSCDDPDFGMQPRTFYAPEIDPPKSEPPQVEGDVFVNFTTGCGSNIGRGGKFSLWLTARDTDLPVVTADSQLANLAAAMDFYPCIDADVRGALDAALQAAVSAFADYKSSGDPDDQAEAIAQLDAFIAVVDANPGGFAACASNVNVAGELIARSDAAQFTIAKVVVGDGGPFTIALGDNDGFGFGDEAVPDNAPLLNINLPEDRRSPAEAAATDGAQQTDFYSANFTPLPSDFDAVFTLPGQVASATLEIDMGGVQASDFGQLDVEFNGVPQPGLLNFQDGPTDTRVRQFPLSADAIANANEEGAFRVTIKRGASSDAIAFDYFELTGTTTP